MFMIEFQKVENNMNENIQSIIVKISQHIVTYFAFEFEKHIFIINFF